MIPQKCEEPKMVKEKEITATDAKKKMRMNRKASVDWKMWQFSNCEFAFFFVLCAAGTSFEAIYYSLIKKFQIETEFRLAHVGEKKQARSPSAVIRYIIIEWKSVFNCNLLLRLPPLLSFMIVEIRHSSFTCKRKHFMLKCSMDMSMDEARQH